MIENEEGFSDIRTDPVSEFYCSDCHTRVDAAGMESFAMVDCPHCGGLQVVPARLGDYLLVDLLGEGATATVFEGLDENLNRPVALKVLHPHLARDEEFLANLRHEAKLAASLNHPHIAHVYALSVVDDQPFVVMEKLSGGSLKDMMDAHGALPQRQVLEIGIDIAKGIEAAAEGNLIHGDIKPDNIMFDEKHTAKIVDFGLAAPMGGNNELSGIWGSPHYIAPECLRKEKPDHLSDTYSLGATLYHALCGKYPFPGDTMEKVLQPRLKRAPFSILRHNKKIAPEIDKLLARMMQPERSKRHPNFTSLLGSMKRACDALPKTHRIKKNFKKTGRSSVAIARPTGRTATAKTGKKPAERKPARKKTRRAPVSDNTVKRRVAIGIILAAILILIAFVMSKPPGGSQSKPRVGQQSSLRPASPQPRLAKVNSHPPFSAWKDGFVVFEAERFHASYKSAQGTQKPGRRWIRIQNSKAFGSVAMQVPDDDAFSAKDYAREARLEYQVRIPESGRYTIWLRGRANPNSKKAGTSDSAHMLVDGKKVSTLKAIDGFRKPTFRWSKENMQEGQTTVSLSKGLHVFSLCMREDGLLVDRIAIALTKRSQHVNFTRSLNSRK